MYIFSDLPMDVTYSLLFAVFISFLLIFTKFANIHWVNSCITWLKNIIYLRSLPSPPRRWFLGHALELANAEKSLTYMKENHRKYSKLCVYWIGPFIPFVYTGDVEAMKTFLYQPGESPKPEIHGFLEKWIGEGLTVASGTKWKRQRKMLTPTFHFDMLKQYVPVYNEVSDKLLEIWSSFADSGESVNISQYAKPVSMEVLLKCMYSSTDGCLENKESLYLVAAEKLLSLTSERVFTPYYAFDWVYFSTAAGRKFLHYCDVVHKFSDDVIMQRRKELQQGVKQPRKYQDFVDILLSIKDENGKGLTDREIRDELDTFITAGHHTVATAFSWCLYCLAKYKEHQEMCRKEIREILTGRDSANITWEDLSKLDYITMCIKETLRLYTIIPFVGKLSSEDFIINGYRIPKGFFLIAFHYFTKAYNFEGKTEACNFLTFTTKIQGEADPGDCDATLTGMIFCFAMMGSSFAAVACRLCIYHTLGRKGSAYHSCVSGFDAMHHDPLIWNEPEKFDPMRFTADNCKNRDNFTFLAFSAGPRNCIGQRFALHQLKVVLANILNRFNLELDTSHEVQPYFNGFCIPKNGIKLKFYSAI